MPKRCGSTCAKAARPTLVKGNPLYAALASEGNAEPAGSNHLDATNPL